MVFNNSGYIPTRNGMGNGSLASLSTAPVLNVNKSMPLNASMIDRVHRAKPGCSACGKKVA